MGQKMSVNEHLIHSIKKLRVSNADDTYVNDKTHTEIRLYDPTSPPSPFRKQYGGQKSVLDRAICAPFERSPTFNNEYEQISMKGNEHNECIDHAKQFVNISNTRIIESKFYRF